MMKNKTILIAIFLFALMVMSVAVILIAKTDMKKTGTEDKDDLVSEVESDVKIITFAVPNICRIDENNLQYFNDELIKDGYHYMLEVKYLEFTEYTELLEGELKSGDTDIAFLGLGNTNGSNDIYHLINTGFVLNLDELLSQERGEALYNAFPQNLWESVKCNNHIYSIPSVMANDQGVYVAFNRDYITDDDIEEWDGSIEGIYEIIKDVEWDDSDAPRFQYLISDYSFEDMIRCEIRYGLLFDYETLSIENPLESEKFIGYLNVLDQMKQDGYMSDSISYLSNPGLNSAEVLRNADECKYLVALSSGTIDEVFLKDNIAVKKINPYLSSRINGSIAISKKAEDINSVADFLSLLYGDSKYGNILLYGQEGTDYKVINGVAYNMDGTDLQDEYLAKLCFNLFVNVYPVRGENFMCNRRNEFFSFYDSIELSPFIGFEPDTVQLNNASNDLDGFMNSLNDRNVDEAILHAGDKLKSDSMDEYLHSIRNQWEEYLR